MAATPLEKESIAHRAEQNTQNDVDGITSPPTPSSNLDDSYDVYKQGRDIVIDSSQARRVRRKIDWHIMPILLVTYGINYLDKNSVSFASVYGLQAATHLVGQDYSWLCKYLKSLVVVAYTFANVRLQASIFYFGYFFSQFPAGYLMQRYAAGRFLGFMALIWVRISSGIRTWRRI